LALLPIIESDIEVATVEAAAAAAAAAAFPKIGLKAPKGSKNISYIVISIFP
jgi:hypothetical protein